LADKLLAAMRGWLDAQKASASADAAAVSDMDKWIQERSTIAGQTAALTREARPPAGSKCRCWAALAAPAHNHGAAAVGPRRVAAGGAGRRRPNTIASRTTRAGDGPNIRRGG